MTVSSYTTLKFVCNYSPSSTIVHFSAGYFHLTDFKPSIVGGIMQNSYTKTVHLHPRIVNVLIVSGQYRIN
jgi:hypothetical protein